MSNLTPKQEKFVQGLVSGLSQREAYKQAVLKMSGVPRKRGIEVEWIR